MTSKLARLGLVMALALAGFGLVPACDDDGGGGPGGGGSADARVSVFVDAPAVADAAPDAPAVVPGSDGGTALLACSISEVTPLFQCAFENCVTLPDPGSLPDGGGLPSFDLTELGSCAVLQCGSLLLDLSPGCQRCLLGAFAGGATGALDGCVSGGLPELPELPGLPTP